MRITIEHDRAAQFLVSTDPSLDFDLAQARLEKAALALSFDGDAREPWCQAALLMAVRCGARMFRGGVFLEGNGRIETALRLEPRGDLRRTLARLGLRASAAPEHAIHLHVGHRPPAAARLACFADGWRGVVGPRPQDGGARPGNEVSGPLAGALGVSEAFRIAVLGDLRAGRRLKSVSAWGPNEPEDARIAYLPRSLWLLGLGNLGQATLSILGLLPYADGCDLSLVMQDFDDAGPENLLVQVLTEPAWLGLRKTRGAAGWAEARGFATRLVETPFSPHTRPGSEDPRILLGGLDNLDARRWAAAAGFDLVIDAGLGALSVDAFDFRLHAFPGARGPDEAWPEIRDDRTLELSPALQKAVDQGRLDLCGAMTIAGKSVGVPCTAAAAAAVQVGQLCRALAEGRCCDLVDLSLADVEPGTFKLMAEPLAPLAFTPSASPA
jgi:hypothetical protein